MTVYLRKCPGSPFCSFARGSTFVVALSNFSVSVLELCATTSVIPNTPVTEGAVLRNAYIARRKVRAAAPNFVVARAGYRVIGAFNEERNTREKCPYHCGGSTADDV
jgi:hypothetical protein